MEVIPYLRPDHQQNFLYSCASGFEGVDDFFTHLCDYIVECLRTKANCDTSAATQQQLSGATDDQTAIKTIAADRTTAANAANLKASQQCFLDQSQVIDGLKNNSTDRAAMLSNKCLAATGSNEVKREGGQEKEDSFLVQLRSNNNVSPTTNPH